MPLLEVWRSRRVAVEQPWTVSSGADAAPAVPETEPETVPVAVPFPSPFPLPHEPRCGGGAGQV